MSGDRTYRGSQFQARIQACAGTSVGLQLLCVQVGSQLHFRSSQAVSSLDMIDKQPPSCKAPSVVCEGLCLGSSIRCSHL